MPRRAQGRRRIRPHLRTPRQVSRESPRERDHRRGRQVEDPDSGHRDVRLSGGGRHGTGPSALPREYLHSPGALAGALPRRVLLPLLRARYRGHPGHVVWT